MCKNVSKIVNENKLVNINFIILIYGYLQNNFSQSSHFI